MADIYASGDKLIGRRVNLPDGRTAFIPGSIALLSDGETIAGILPAGTDRSGSVGTVSTQLAPANAVRRSLNIQNISANTLGINEFGGAAVIGGAGTYTLAPGASVNVRTNRQINVVGSTGTSVFTATEA